MYQAFMDYVNMAENQNAARTEYIQTMKAQLHSLAQLQVNIYKTETTCSDLIMDLTDTDDLLIGAA